MRMQTVPARTQRTMILGCLKAEGRAVWGVGGGGVVEGEEE